jgi:hypothetical protein
MTSIPALVLALTIVIPRDSTVRKSVCSSCIPSMLVGCMPDTRGLHQRTFSIIACCLTRSSACTKSPLVSTMRNGTFNLHQTPSINQCRLISIDNRFFKTDRLTYRLRVARKFLSAVLIPCRASNNNHSILSAFLVSRYSTMV